MQRLMTVAEVCAELEISRFTWDKWRAKKKGPKAKRLPNGELRVTVEEFQAWLDGLEAA